MASLGLAAFAVTLLTLLAAALPTVSAAVVPRADTETWRIPRMELHMMTHHSGLPGGGGWPEDVQYKSSIDFDIGMPDVQLSDLSSTHGVHCYAEFANGTLPDGITTCSNAIEGERVGFRMEEHTELGPRRKELSFVLQVIRVESINEQPSAMVGEVPITVNDPSEPSSYLTCLLGAPFDGLRCKLNGGLSNHRDGS